MTSKSAKGSSASKKAALSDEQLESVVGGSGRRPTKKPARKIVKAKKRH